MTTRVVTVLALWGMTLLTPVVATAEDAPLSQLLVDLIQSDVRLAPPPPGFVSHEAHFIPGSSQQLAPNLFNQELVALLATFPTGSPSGGFSFTFDPTNGTFKRATESFGPSFAERAFTNGKNKLTIGANFQYSKYTSFEGTSLDNGDVKFFLRHAPTGGAFFEGDLIQAALKLSLSSNTTTLFANYGVTDRWDVAVAVPIEHVSMDATVDATILRLATGDLPLHSFPGGGTTATFTSAGRASGIGDVVLRTKYRFVSTPGGGLGAGFDLRLPSGDADNLIGTGATQAAFTLIGSTTVGALAPHFNVGYASSSAGKVVNIPDEVGYRFGTEFVVKPTATLSADVVGRTLRQAGRLQFEDTPWNYTDFANVSRSTTLHELISTPGSLNLISLALGGKVNVTGNLLVSANVLVALTSTGVTARITPVIGFDYSF
jgi:hypothetical protein